MKTIRDARDLERYGINLLTGEACRVGRRILTDLTAKGAEIVPDLLEIDHQQFRENWNSKVNGEPAVASFMLPYSMIHELVVWCLIQDSCTAIVEAHSEYIYGREDSDDAAHWAELVEHWRHHYDGHIHTITLKGGPARGTRMVHAMSGRSE
jgi:hypothetical protein